MSAAVRGWNAGALGTRAKNPGTRTTPAFVTGFSLGNRRFRNCRRYPLDCHTMVVAGRARGPALTERRFPPPWTVEDIGAAFVVTDSAGQKSAYVYFEGEARVGMQLMRLVTNYLVVRGQRYCKMGRHSPDSQCRAPCYKSPDERGWRDDGAWGCGPGGGWYCVFG